MPGKKRGKKGGASSSSSSSSSHCSGPPAAAVTAPTTRVVLHSLKAAAHHNGKLGTVVSYDPDAGRVVVRLDEGGDVMVKPQNLDKQKAEDGEVALIQMSYWHHRNFYCNAGYCEAIANAEYNTLEPVMHAIHQGIRRVGTWNTQSPDKHTMQRTITEDNMSGRIGVTFAELLGSLESFDEATVRRWVDAGLEHSKLMVIGSSICSYEVPTHQEVTSRKLHHILTPDRPK